MSKRLIVANVIIVAVAAFFVVHLVRDFTHSPVLPPPRAPRPAPAAAAPPPDGAAPVDTLASYNVIPTKSLFSPTRTEGAAAGPSPGAAPLPPKPVLHGVIVDDPRSLAYLEDPVTKRIFAYRVGDTVAGGKLERISMDRVVIRRSDGDIDVLLNDPAKLPAGPAPPQPGASPTPPAMRPVRPTASPPSVRAPRRLPTEQPSQQ